MSEIPKIFISHSSKNNDVVEKIVSVFKEYDISHWVDLKQLKSVDSDVILNMSNGLKENNYFLLVWSDDAEESDLVTKEYTAATSGEYDKQLKKIIIRLDDAKLPPFLASKKYHRANLSNIESVIKGILGVIKGDFKTQVKLFKEKIISDYETFPEKPIVPNFKKFDGHKFYVQQPFRSLSNPRREGDEIADAMLETLTNSPKRLQLIVGDYGSGKSALCHYLMYKLCKIDDDESVPIFVALGSIKNHDDSHNNLKMNYTITSRLNISLLLKRMFLMH